MASSALVTTMSLDSDDIVYSYNESPTSPLAHINVQLEEIRGELRVVREELYEVHCAIADTRALVKMVERHVKPKPKPHVPIQYPPAEA
ncbi:uncharacterized protein G2W53_035004 [Senna tora]|uniref:Uncharacterized protein n=1 Tax=Senna tora TaxID=362788 RepID=A0A834SRL7_9FABA|nr:uncharacterized protein G2W53_035004 [Senna tora]